MSGGEIRPAAILLVNIRGWISRPSLSRKAALTAAAAILLATVAAPRPSMAEDASAQSPSTLFGYLDPETGNFIPQGPEAPPSAARAAAASPIFRRGTLVVVETFSTPTTVPAKALFQNIVTVSVSSQAGTVSFSDSAGSSGVAHRNGGSGRIVVKVPYLFAVASASAPVTVSCLMTSPTGDEAMLTQKITIPENNATTTLNISQRF